MPCAAVKSTPETILFIEQFTHGVSKNKFRAGRAVSWGIPKTPMFTAPPHIFLLGATSIVGYNVARLNHPGLRAYVTSRGRHAATAHLPRLALHEPTDVAAFAAALPPGATIIYCDAVCDVSKCEENPAWAREINIANLDRLLAVLPAGARLVYVSSDHVFGNDGTYDETAQPCPVSIYGGIRAEAEQLALSWPGALVIRYGLPVGPSVDNKSGHLNWLQYRLRKGLPVTIVTDEARMAMPTPLLAQRIVELAESPLAGIRHITSERLISRPDLARTLKRHFELPGTLLYRTRAEQPAPHLGRIHLVTRHTDDLAAPLPCPIRSLHLPESCSASAL